MATSYTSLIGLALPVTGELSGTWGDTVNNYISTYIDSAVAGTQTISGSQTAVTLSVTNGSALSQAGSGATGSAQYTIINCTGNPAGTLTITAPASSKSYIIINSTSTSQSVKIVGAGPTTGVTVASGDKALVAWNGSDFVRVGASAGGSNTQVQYNSSGNLAGSANMTFDGTKLTVGNILDSGLTASQAVFTDASKNLVSVATTGTGSVVLGTGPTITLANGTGLPLTTGVSGQLPVANGGTNSNTANGGFNNLSPMTTAGDIIYGGVSGAGTRLGIGSNGYVLTVSSGAPVWAAASSGVTSVAQSFTGGIVSVTGSPITTSGTLALTVAGTSGGVPYFSSGTTWASSAALTQYGIVYGGGAGNAPVATAAGTTGQFLGANTGGAPTWQTPSGGGSPGGSNTQVQFNNSSAFGGSANFVWDGTYVGVGTSSPSTYSDSTPGITTYNSAAGGRSGIVMGSNATATDDLMGYVSFFNSNSSNTNYRMASLRANRGADANSSYLTMFTANSGAPAESLRVNGVGTVILKGGSTSATGVGITFPATQSASTDANTLDDYEEGTWTPSTTNAYNSSPTLTYTTQSGSYTKVGRMVTLAFVIEYATFSGGGGPIFFGGLPFTPAQTTDPRFQGTIYLSGPNTPASTVSVTVGYAKLDNGSYYNCFICSRDDIAMANTGVINCADLSAGDVIAGTWTYFV